MQFLNLPAAHIPSGPLEPLPAFAPLKKPVNSKQINPKEIGLRIPTTLANQDIPIYARHHPQASNHTLTKAVSLLAGTSPAPGPRSSTGLTWAGRMLIKQTKEDKFGAVAKRLVQYADSGLECFADTTTIPDLLALSAR